MTQEVGIFSSFQITEQEAGEVGNISHSELLREAFDTLTEELDNNGNSQRFQQLRDEYGIKLVAYWQNKRSIFEKAKKEGRLQGETFINGDEKLTIAELGVYERDDEVVLQINTKTDTEENEVSITVSTERGLDEFLRPPKIESKIRTDPAEPPDIHYTIVFRNGKISTFERLIFHCDPEYNRPYIKDTRVIDCSIFGVEI